MNDSVWSASSSKAWDRQGLRGSNKELCWLFNAQGRLRLIISARQDGETMADEQPNNPLHGITLKRVLEDLVERRGWWNLGETISIRCFTHDPSMQSSLKFLRKTEWARTKVEELYVHDYFEMEQEAERLARLALLPTPLKCAFCKAAPEEAGDLEVSSVVLRCACGALVIGSPSQDSGEAAGDALQLYEVDSAGATGHEERLELLRAAGVQVQDGGKDQGLKWLWFLR